MLLACWVYDVLFLIGEASHVKNPMSLALCLAKLMENALERPLASGKKMCYPQVYQVL